MESDMKMPTDDGVAIPLAPVSVRNHLAQFTHEEYRQSFLFPLPPLIPFILPSFQHQTPPFPSLSLCHHIDCNRHFSSAS